MGPAEVGRRLYKKFFPTKPPNIKIKFPKTEAVAKADPADAAEVNRILAGDWKAFGKIPLKVDDPPRWNYDYLAGVEVPSSGKINHRHLPGGADVKLIWELSRWYELVRLAEGGEKEKCIRWLEDWVAKNPPYEGVNWTSALESGIRMIHFTRMDSFLDAVGLRNDILPAHVWFTWKERSFGSSANNHLLGELAGVIVACSRWPALESLCAPMDRLQREWEREVLAQFAEDGGNREQALSYHAFSLDLCIQTRTALIQAGRKISSAVEERLRRADQFYDIVQVRGEQWDYGDSDDAVRRTTHGRPEPDRWHYFSQSGIARYHSGDWDLRWDLSPLGYLSTAAHGHLDALHLSIWWKGMAVVIDPGTGAYYGDPQLRAALSGWDAHNGPHLPGQDFPKRLGPFLWSQHHATPKWHDGRGEFRIVGTVGLLKPHGTFSRTVTKIQRGWEVQDAFEAHRPFIVRWQFAPGAELVPAGKQTWRLKRKDVQFDIQVSCGSAEIGDTVVSPGFRQTAQAPFLELRTGAEACVLRTKFLSC